MKSSQVKISHPEKVLFPLAQVSKKQTAAYYNRIAPTMLPHIAERPLTLKQFPHGISSKGFYRKHAPDYFPEYIKRIDVDRVDPTLEPVIMATADEPADLIYLAGQNVIEIHIATSTATSLSNPDQVVFDLDPSDYNFASVRKLALGFKHFFDDHGVPSFIKLSGGRGMHIHVPVQPTQPFKVLKPWALRVAQLVAEQFPALATLEHLKANRHGRIFIDVSRNDYAQSVIAPYSLRAKPGAPIAAPVDWHELSRNKVYPGCINVSGIHRRLAQKADPWSNFAQSAVSPTALPKLLNLRM